MKSVNVLLVATLLSVSVAARSEASSIVSSTCPTIGTFDRQMTVTGATACYAVGAVNGTPNAGDVQDLFGASWSNNGQLAGSNGSNGLLTVFVTQGVWGGIPASGTWAVDPDLWSQYPRVVLSFHLGNGGGDPDWFFFDIDRNATFGEWSVRKLSGDGGGLSNVNLWTDPPANGPELAPVPEPGTLALLLSGFGVGAAAFVKRRRRR